MPEILEACMVICFGCSWPLSIAKSWRARTAKGKSLPFLLLITAGYICGIFAKITGGHITYVFVFYCINLMMLLTELALYARNTKLDRAQAAKMR